MATKMAHEQGEWEITLDIRNAFNSVSLLEMLKYVAAELPDLLGYFMATYIRARPKLMFRHMDGTMHAIVSQRGVKQGDPLGPLLFCGAISSCLQRFNVAAKAANARERVAAYMDDTSLHSAARQLEPRHITALQQLKADLGAKGCEVNYLKCGALPGRGHLVTEGEKQLLDGLGIQLQGGMVDSSTRSMVVLGVPVGNSDFVSHWVAQQTGPVSRAASFAQRCADLSSPRAMYTLLRCCAVPRLTYMLRNVPPDMMTGAIGGWDRLIQ